MIERIDAAYAAGNRRVLLVSPTGAGKTLIAREVIAARRAGGVLVVAHRRELIEQASKKLHAVGIAHGIIQAGFPTSPSERVQVASIQTLHARAVRGRAMELPRAALVVVDEAHHAPAKTYRQIIEAYPEALLLGLTATPCRADGRGLGDIFEMIVETAQVAELIASGFLVPTKVFAPSRPDLKGVQVARGDYVESELAERMDEPKLVGDVVEHWLRLGERRRTVVFATGVAHSVHLRDEFRRANVLAEHLDGETPLTERERILADLSAGKIEVVTNAQVLTEGWDCPAVSCIVLARPTRHHGLFRQMVGRTLRAAPGKVDALVLDHAGAVFEHGFAEEPVEWTLAPDRRAVNPRQAARAEHRAPQLVSCPEGGAVRFEGRPCPGCGWRAQPKPRAVAVADGDLGRVDRQRGVEPHVVTAAERERFRAQLVWIARERRFKPGWVRHKYREKFGVWPDWRVVEPMPPEPATLAWVRSRLIAWARSKDKLRGAA